MMTPIVDRLRPCRVARTTVCRKRGSCIVSAATSSTELLLAGSAACGNSGAMQSSSASIEPGQDKQSRLRISPV